MAGIRDLSNAWQTVTELDVRPLREQAERGVRIALVGKAGSGRQALADQMRKDPSRPEKATLSPLYIIDLETADGLPEVDLVILLINAADRDDRLERARVRTWLDDGNRVFVLINRPGSFTPPENGGLEVDPWLNWGKRHVLVGPADDPAFLTREFVPAVMHLLPDLHLALGRYFPLFRVPIAHHLINDACFTNAAYALSTGLVEIVPILNIPLNVTDVLILTKNQIFLVYKIGLALGLPTDFQSYIATFGGVLGAGFFWRQMARMLVGFIPGWGVIPKAAVAYAGTTVVGNTVLQWYLSGRHISKEQVSQLYSQALARGRQLVPRFRRDRKQLASGEQKKGRRLRPARGTKALGTTQASAPSLTGAAIAVSQVDQLQRCSNCGRTNAADASFCQYCGKPLGA